MTTGPIEMLDQPPQPVALVRGHVENSEYGAFIARAFDEVRELLAHQRLSPAGPPFARWRATGVGLDVEAGFPVDEDVRPTGRVTVDELPGGHVGTAVHEGDYDTVGFTYEAIREWLAGNDYEPAGDPWEFYLDEPVVASPRTMVAIPCRRARLRRG